MEKLLSTRFIFILFVLFFLSSVVLYGDPGGRTGRTLKTSTAGCGGCHGSSAVNDVIVTISGADSVTQGQTVQYTLTVSKAGKTGAGLDIATRRGTLAPVSGNIHLSNGELTQNFNIPMTGGTVTVTFSYTAPATPGVIDTIWATGLATNSNGNASGDDWNWALSKKVIIRNTVGIEPLNNSSLFSLSQNYPNPFNPSTSVDLQIQKRGNVKIKIYDVSGEEVCTVYDGMLEEGIRTFTWDSKNYTGDELQSGVYFLKLTYADYTETRKLILLK